MAVSYILKRSRKRRKTISLQITRQADVVVLAPYFTPVKEINGFIVQKSEWIQKNIQRQKSNSCKATKNNIYPANIFIFWARPTFWNYFLSKTCSQVLFSGVVVFTLIAMMARQCAEIILFNGIKPGPENTLRGGWNILAAVCICSPAALE